MISPKNNLEQILEAVLFAYGESLTITKLASLTKKGEAEVINALNNLKKTLTNRGLKLINKDKEWQLTAREDAGIYIEKLVKNEIRDELTPASLEVLAIVAYKNNATRLEIETIRGVNSIYAIRNLLIRGLIEKAPDPAKSVKYQISLAALRKLGIEKLSDLPSFNELNSQTDKAETLLNKTI